MQSYSVLIFLGTDNKLRFVPQIESDIGVYAPILEGVEVQFEFDENSIGLAYTKTRQHAINHFGELICFKNAPLKHKAFKGFKSKRDFNSKHYCISSFLVDGEIKFAYLPLHEGEFVNFTTDPQFRKSIPENSNILTIGKTILEIFKMADKAYPEKHILSKSNDFNIELPSKSVTLFFKNANNKFFDKVKTLLREIQVEDYKNCFSLISSFDLHCLVESENLMELNLLANECEELFCFCSHSTVGLYGFFHYKGRECLRGYLSLDESGTVIHNVGEKSHAEKTLNFNFPPDDNNFANDEFDEINHDSLEKILSLIIKEN